MNALLKKLHMYAGLLTFVNLVVFGIAGLWATLEPAPDKRARPEPGVRFEEFTPAAGATDQQVAEAVYAKLRPALAAPVPSWAVRRDRDNNLALDFYSVNGVERVAVLEKEKRLRIESRRNNGWQYLSALHETTSGERAADLRLRLWAWQNELAIWSLLAMPLSGAYLWLSSRPGYAAARVAVVAGAVAFGLLYFLTR